MTPLLFVTTLIYFFSCRPVHSAAPNIIFILTDDQDVQLGSMVALPTVKRYIESAGSNFTNFFVNTPICCPSRATILSGKYNHNNRCSGPDVSNFRTGTDEHEDAAAADCCMYMNTSGIDNPEWEQHNFANALQTAGYVTGIFGKYLNNVPEACQKANNYTPPPGWTHYYAFCDVEYYNATWNIDGKFVKTGDAPTDYTTSIIGNASIEWINSVAKGSKPFFAYIAPHAPHLPATPAPWYINSTDVPNKAPITFTYNYSGADHHWLISQQGIITANQATQIDNEFNDRLKTLMSVDDIVKGVVAALQNLGVFNNTYLFYTSDHGYSLGQFRVPSRKSQVYDHVTRVPAFASGPKIAPGSSLSIPISMADLAPTWLDLAGYTGPFLTQMDGKSFAQYLTSPPSAHAKLSWRDTLIIEYSSIHNVSTTEGHIFDCFNNSYIALRTINSTANLLYAEFVQIEDWQFENPYFYELYDLNKDPYQTTNIYTQVSSTVQQQLHTSLHTYFHCKGSGTDAGACS